MPLMNARSRVLLTTLVLLALAAAQQEEDDEAGGGGGCGCGGFSDSFLLSDEFSEYTEELQLDDDEHSSSNSTSSGQHEKKPHENRPHEERQFFDERVAEDLRAIVLNLAKRNEMLTEKIDKFPRMMKRVYKSAAAAASARERENKPPVNVAVPAAQPQYPNEKIIIVKSKSRSRSKSSDSSSESEASSESSSSSKSESSTNLSKQLGRDLTYNNAALDTFTPYPAASKRYSEPRHRRRKYEQQEREPPLAADDYKDVKVQDVNKSHYGSMKARPRYKQRGYSFKYERKIDVYDASRRPRSYQQARRARYGSAELHRHKEEQERGTRSRHDYYTPSSRYKDKFKHREFS